VVLKDIWFGRPAIRVKWNVVVVKKMLRIYSYFSLITILALNFREASSERLILIPSSHPFLKPSFLLILHETPFKI